jgi:hypothetical protein
MNKDSQKPDDQDTIKGDYGQFVLPPIINPNPPEHGVWRDLGNGHEGKTWDTNGRDGAGSYGLMTRPKGIQTHGDYPHQTEYRNGADETTQPKPNEKYTNPHNSQAKLDETGVPEQYDNGRIKANHHSIERPVLNGGFWLQPDRSDMLNDHLNLQPSQSNDHLNPQPPEFVESKSQPSEKLQIQQDTALDSSPCFGNYGNPNPNSYLSEVNGKIEPGNTIGADKMKERTDLHNRVMEGLEQRFDTHPESLVDESETTDP